MPDFYSVLGIEKGANDEDIKRAYRKLALKYHPDKNGGDKEHFQKIQEAYEVLSNPQRRQEYDNPHQNVGANFDFDHGFPFGFQGFFNHHFRQEKAQQTKLPNHTYLCKISLKDAYFGITKKLKVKRNKLCDKCFDPCKNCNGEGKITFRVQMGPLLQISHKPCDNCNGRGQTHIVNTQCDVCLGRGKFTEDRVIEIIVSKGTESGKQVVFEEWGEQIQKKGDKPGDLIVRIEIDDDENFKRQGLDLIYNAPISLQDSIVGKIMDVPHFDGTFALNTRGFGIINPHKQFTLYERGLIDEKGNKGNLHFRFNIVYPEKVLEDFEAQLLSNAFSTVHL